MHWPWLLDCPSFFLQVPYAYDIVRYAGAAYLTYLAWQTFTRKNQIGAPKGCVKRHSLTTMFRQGLITNILNPKVALFFLALFPQFITPENGAVGFQIMVLAIVLNIIALIVNGTVVLMAGSIKNFGQRTASFAQYSRYFLGTVFAGLALKLVFDDQN